MSTDLNTTETTPTHAEPTNRRGKVIGLSVIAAALIALVVGGLLVTGGRGQAPTRTHVALPSPSAAGAASASANVPTTGATKREDITTADGIAQSYIEATLSDLTILNAPTAADTLSSMSAYLSDTMQRDVQAKSADDSQREALFNDVAPFGYKGAITKADLGKVAVQVYNTSATSTDVRYDASVVWTEANGTVLHVHRTGTYRLIPGADATGYRWQIDSTGANHTDIN